MLCDYFLKTSIHACAIVLVKDLTMLLFFLQFSLMFSFSSLLFVCKNFWTYITLFTQVLMRLLEGVIFIFGPGMYFQTGQVIFVPEWPKGEFVRL
jgi:hypothetical protein